MTVTRKMFFENSGRVPWHLIAALAYSESSFNPKAKSRAGAMGLMQFLPMTWQEWAPDGADPFDPEISIVTAGQYMGWLIDQTESTREALVAYMWGIGNVKKLGYLKAPEIVLDRADMILFMSEGFKLWRDMEEWQA